MENIIEKIRIALDRTVPITDPSYIIGEDDSLKEFEKLCESVEHREGGMLGAVILGQIGNGKTHFLRYVRQYYSNISPGFIGIYIPDMFVNGPLVDAINGIYKSIFYGPGNISLTAYLANWIEYKNKVGLEELSNHSNNIFRFLAICNGEDEEKLLLEYFSGKDLIPDQYKHLRNRFGLKKKIINNENDFCSLIGYSLGFICEITGKNILFLFDEVDKVYSSETNKILLSRVGTKILALYRALFDYLNNIQIKGIIAIGATPEAWDVLSTQAAFERRFKDNKIILKVPKSKDDCIEFLKFRLNELNLLLSNQDLITITQLVNSLPEEKRKTWAEVISNIKNKDSNMNIKTAEDPAQEILEVLKDAIAPLTWNEILEQSELLQRIYPKSQPTTLLSKLQKENKIKINPTRPKTYEPVYEPEESEDLT